MPTMVSDISHILRVPPTPPVYILSCLIDLELAISAEKVRETSVWKENVHSTDFFFHYCAFSVYIAKIWVHLFVF